MVTKPGMFGIKRFYHGASRLTLVILLLVHAGLVAWIDVKNSPNPDETAHLAAGIAILQSSRFDLYPVNPPLVRLIAALPVYYGCPEGNWQSIQDRSMSTFDGVRPEWAIGIRLVRDNADRIMSYFTLARLACIPISLIGGYFCWRWANDLYGAWPASLALMMWCFSPAVLAWSATICPDVAAASLGIAACYSFRRWLKARDWYTAIIAGVMLGLAELAKMTWIFLFPLWPVVWLLWSWGRRRGFDQPPWPKQAIQVASILTLSVFVLNLGYAFDGTFTRLGTYTFFSHTLASNDSVVDGGHGGNRSDDTWLRFIPIPLPKDYVEGADLQKVDFEVGLPSYLLGNWSPHGWWYYYAVCAVFKVPLGIWIIGILALVIRIARLVLRVRELSFNRIAYNGFDWLEEVILLLPPGLLIVFVSSQNGFSRHYRYILPAAPFLFVWCGSVAKAALQNVCTIAPLVLASSIWFVASSLSVFPHSMSYFNELAGGPKGGHRYLLDSNIDWGQDVLYLREWLVENPRVSPLRVALGHSYWKPLLCHADVVEDLDISTSVSERKATSEGKPSEFMPIPGWYAVSIHRMYDPADHYGVFRRLEPVATAGYSIYIFHVTHEHVNRLRSQDAAFGPMLAPKDKG